MQVIEALRLAADDAFKQALEAVARIDANEDKIEQLRECVRNGGADRLRADARVMDLRADCSEERERFAEFVAERVKQPLETLDRVCTLDLDRVADHLARVLPHIDLTEEEVRTLVDAALDADDYAGFRFVASCARSRGLGVSDPYPAFRKQVEHVCDEIRGFTVAVVGDSKSKVPKSKAAYRDNVGELMGRVTKDIDAAERGIHSVTIGDVTRVVPAPRPTVEEATVG